MTSNQKIDFEQAVDHPDMQNSVITVDGQIPNGNLGITLPSETVLGNWLPDQSRPEPRYPDLWDQPVTLDVLGKLRRDIWSNRDNWDLTDVDLIVSELQDFRRLGGASVVNAPYGDVVHPEGLQEIAARSGVNVIASLAPTPQILDEKEEGGIRKYFLLETRRGIQGSQVRPGIFGPVEFIDAEDPFQLRMLKEIFSAQKETGYALIVRPTLGKLDSIVAALKSMGAEPKSVILDVDVAPDPSSIVLQSSEGGAYGAITYARVLPDGMIRAAEEGFYLAFASFGFEVYHDRDWTASARDPQRIKGIAQLIQRGHIYQILISQGLRLKTQMKRYGGWGYAHILENVVPMMQREGFAPKHITSMLIWNPARALACQLAN